MDLQLNDKVALVTGSTAGIGFAIANSLAKEGATVIVNGRTKERVATAIAQIKSNFANAKLIAFAGDVSDAAENQKLFEQAPHVDILVNNVGTYEIKTFAEISDADWLKIFHVNVMSGVQLSRHYMPSMLKQNWGRIVFISSESGLQIPVEMIHYGVTKTAQIALARGLAEMTAGTNVTVNSILPGPTESEGVEHFLATMAEMNGMAVADIKNDLFKSARPSSLLQRLATTDEVANLVTYVCSPLASATNGAALRVEGGIVRAIS